MKVGDYVRYVKWKYKENSQDVRIAKIKDIQEETGYKQKFIFFENGNGEYEDYIIKSSPNIIDLIEVGDYVNGTLVGKIKDIYTTDNIYIGKFLYEKNSSLIGGEEDIKSIVTHEQFSQMEYKVGE